MSLTRQTTSRAITPRHLSIGLLLMLLTTNMRMVSAAPLVLYEDAQFKGKTAIYLTKDAAGGECINLVGKLNDYFSSVDTLGGCFFLCEHRNCGGKCEVVRGKLANLSEINLNDRVSSIKMCSLPEANTTLRMKKKLRQKRSTDDDDGIPTSSSPPLADADT